MDIKDIIAAWICEARKHAGLSQEGLGAKLALALGVERGHTKANISHWETRKTEPSLEQVLAISKITGRLLPDILLKAFSPAANDDEGRRVAGVEINISELLDLIRLYDGSTKLGRDQIMSSAHGAEKRDELGGAASSGD